MTLDGDIRQADSQQWTLTATFVYRVISPLFYFMIEQQIILMFSVIAKKNKERKKNVFL